MKKAASLILLYLLACFAMGAVTITDLTFQVTGILPVANGGTGLSTLYNASYSSGTKTAAISATSLCTTTACPAGTYIVAFYSNEIGTGCTTAGSGAVKYQLSFVNGNSQSVSGVYVPMTQNATSAFGALGMSFTTTGTGTGTGIYVVNISGAAFSGSDSMQIASTITACTTPGSWTGYQVHAVVTRVS